MSIKDIGAEQSSPISFTADTMTGREESHEKDQFTGMGSYIQRSEVKNQILDAGCSHGCCGFTTGNKAIEGTENCLQNEGKDLGMPFQIPYVEKNYGMWEKDGEVCAVYEM